jgi:hypothetical protein
MKKKPYITSFKFPRSLVAALRYTARLESVSRGRDISWRQLLLECAEQRVSEVVPESRRG